MSGHSKWSTIKRKKGINDQARGQLFSKLSKGITIAAKTGGGGDPETNFKLRMAIDTAKQSNMPKANIDRAISNAQDSGELSEVTYEGFGPSGEGIIVDVATDNTNRSAQEIKTLFERGGGRFAGPGAVSHSFDMKGMLFIEKKNSLDEDMLSLIDLGVEDVDGAEGGIEAFVAPDALYETKQSVESKGFVVKEAALIQKPRLLHDVASDKADKDIEFLQKLEEHDDVQKVFTNLNVT